jgi:hypothetical protein
MVTIEKPTPIRSNPMPTVQRRSKPVNGRSFELVAFAVGELLVVVVEGDTPLAGVLASFDGDVPLAGAGVVAAGVVAGVVPAGVVLAGVVGVVGVVVGGVGGFWA